MPTQPRPHPSRDDDPYANVGVVRLAKEDIDQRARIHRTATGVLVRSKSEVIVADTLTRLGISYEYETELVGLGRMIRPDFTITRGARTWYWEHLGMLDDRSYALDWKSKERWYAKMGLAERLITSSEIGGIDSVALEKLASSRILSHTED